MKIAILGCGVMGSAFARQFAKHKQSLFLCDRHVESSKALAKELDGRFIENPKKVASEANVILLAIKPKDLANLAKELTNIDGQIVISILAGVNLNTLKKYFPKGIVVRAMPNLALTCQESVIALADDPALSKQVKEKIGHLLEGLGMVFWIEEDKIDAISALAGSGPAFIIAIIEALVESGIAMGIKPALAKELVLQTIQGAIALVKTTPGHPGKIRWDIAAPGGTTIEGLKAFEKHAVRHGIMETILATFRRAKEHLG